MNKVQRIGRGEERHTILINKGARGVHDTTCCAKNVVAGYSLVSFDSPIYQKTQPPRSPKPPPALPFQEMPELAKPRYFCAHRAPYHAEQRRYLSIVAKFAGTSGRCEGT